MFDRLLNRLKPRQLEPQVLPHPSTEQNDFAKMEVYKELESTLPDEQPQREEPQWQLPLPFDIMFTIINTFIVDNEPLRNISCACRSLWQICRPLRFRTVSISTSNRNEPTSLERFAQFLSHNPKFINHIHTLRILDRGKMFQGSRPITPEEESLCYILLRQFPNLRRLELSLHVVWDLVPSQVQSSFYHAFKKPTLREVAFEHVRIPLSLLCYLSGISSLDFRGEASPSKNNPESQGDFCKPERLLVADTSRTGFVLNNLLREDSGLQLSSLKTLEVYASGVHMQLLNGPLLRCSTTLTSLSLFLSTWGGGMLQFLLSIDVHSCSISKIDPTSIDLSPLRLLTSLTLTADMEKLPYVPPGFEGPRRFDWLIETLSTCHSPSRLERITLIIRIQRFDFAKYLPWQNLAALFEPHPSERWPRLKRLDLKNVNEWEDRFYKQGTLERIVFPLMPVLSNEDLVKIETSSEKLSFWRM